MTLRQQKQIFQQQAWMTFRISPPSEERIAKAVIQQISYSEFYQGPLPSPKDMKGYQEINPDFPDRIMQMTEKQLDHKIAMEQKALNAGIQSALRGQIIAAFLFLTVLGVGTYMIYLIDYQAQLMAYHT